MSDFAPLRERHRSLRDGMPLALNLRVHRALSWLQRAEQCSDADGRFVFLWIAFNAAYAQEMPHNARLSEHENFREFWAQGMPALMVTDTSFMRNPHYHLASDTPDTLDYLRMAEVIKAVYAVVVAH